jgi:hypothetical protein
MTVKIHCWDRQGGCPQKPFLRMAEDFAPNEGENMEEVTCSLEKLQQLAEALGVSYADFADPDAALDELISAAAGNNGNGAEDLEAVEPGQGLNDEVTRMSQWGAPRRFRSKVAEERHTERATRAFFDMLPGERNRNRARR